MREIKFRAWDIKNEIMSTAPMSNIYRNKYSLFGDIYLLEKESFGDTVRVELMQYTGLKDKNGVEIYEGDIFFDDHNEEFGQVTFDEGKFLYETTTFVTDLFEIADALENSGNIYENPELLEESK